MLFLLGATIRFGGVWRPVDLPNWRECDVAGIARNYHREGMALLYPRIDWRGDGPGYVESEFPIYPYAVAALYNVFGVQEHLARVISYALSLLSMLAFFGLARRMLPPTGALAAGAFFVVSPLANLLGHSIQPEGLMSCACWIGVYAYVRWLDEDDWRFFTVSVAAIALSILAKATAAHVGILFALWLIHERGWKRAVSPGPSWVFAVTALAPAAAWYWHANGFFRAYGNSLGISNEDHWARLDLFTNPRLIGGIVGLDVWFVWTIPGLLVAAYGVFRNPRARVARFAGFWLTAVVIYYLVAARTLSALWANYYHIAAVGPAALLVGHGIAESAGARIRAWWIAASAAMAAAGWAGVSQAVAVAAPRYADRVAGAPMSLGVAAVTAVGAALGAWLILRGRSGAIAAWLTAPALVCGVALIGAELTYGTGRGRLACGRELAPLVPPGTLIVASGGSRIGPTGRPAASDAPYMFYWMDRKGFSIAREDQRTDRLDEFARRGARFYVAEKDAVATRPGFEQELRSRYRLAGECRTAWLFELAR